MSTAVVALGSNIHPDHYIEKAYAALKYEFSVKARSSWLKTAPVGEIKQADFLNGVVYLETSLAFESFKARLKDLEIALGRVSRPEKCGPCEIDLDILLWDGKVVNKDYYERVFLRELVAEIAGEMKLRCY